MRLLSGAQSASSRRFGGRSAPGQPHSGCTGGRGRPAPEPTPSLTATPLVASAAARPTPAPYVGLAERRDHHWLLRPVADEHNDVVARFYPYGSRQDGSYPVHHGVEFVNPLGTPVRAVADGEVVVAGGDQLDVLGARDNTAWPSCFSTARWMASRSMRCTATSQSHAWGGAACGRRADHRAGRPDGAAEAPHLHFEVRVALTTISTR